MPYPLPPGLVPHKQGEFFDIDSDGDGEIDREEMRRCLRRAANAPDLTGVDMVREAKCAKHRLTVSHYTALPCRIIL